MNDRFKFRIWDTKQQKYRQRTHNEADTYLNCLTGKVLFGEGIRIYGEEDDKDVIAEQCTGLKDKNGKLIYENDIVEVSEAYETGIYKIEFCQSDCEYNLYNKDGNFIYQLTRSMAKYMKVVGNIHENKELLDE